MPWTTEAGVERRTWSRLMEPDQIPTQGGPLRGEPGGRHHVAWAGANRDGTQ